MSPLPWKTCWAALATASSSLILPRCESCCHGFSVPPIISAANLQYRRHGDHRHNMFPTRLEDWDSRDVENWLRAMGFGRYSPGFAADFGGVGVDGDRLVYLGIEDQLDHIEYQLSLIGVDDESDQRVLGDTIIGLVAASEVSPELIESLARKVPAENRDRNDKDTTDQNPEFGRGQRPEYEI